MATSPLSIRRFFLPLRDPRRQHRRKHLLIDIIDGKTLRGSGNGPKGWKALHLVSASATDCQLSLGQVAVDAKSNKITAIPELLQLLDLHGALVTIDAMGCQTEIAKAVVAGGGDYLFPVKDNQPHLLEDWKTSAPASVVR